MASKSENEEYLILDDVRVSYRQKDNTIHVYSTDADVPHGRFYMVLDRGTPIEEVTRSLLEKKGFIGKKANPNDLKYDHDVIKDFIFDVVTKHSPYHLRIAGSSPSGKSVFHSSLIEKLSATNISVQSFSDEPLLVDLTKTSNMASEKKLSDLEGSLDPFTLFSSSNLYILELAYATIEALFQVDSVYTPKYEKEAFDNAIKRLNISKNYSFKGFIEGLESEESPEGKFLLDYVEHLKTLTGWKLLYSDGTSLPTYKEGLVQWTTDTDADISSLVIDPMGIILWDDIARSRRDNVIEYTSSLMLLLHSLRALISRRITTSPLVIDFDNQMFASIDDRLGKRIFDKLVVTAKEKEAFIVFSSDIKKLSESFTEKEDVTFKLLSFRQFDFDYQERYDWKEVLSDLKVGEYSLIDEKGIINLGLIVTSENISKAIIDKD